MDRRELNHRWYQSFDAKRMRLVILDEDENEVELPAKYEVCSTCDGKGTCVNPSIDRNGLTAEDFAEDPGFAEDYFSGNYDVSCPECHSERIVPTLDEELASSEQRQLYYDTIEHHYDNARERWYERERGY